MNESHPATTDTRVAQTAGAVAVDGGSGRPVGTWWIALVVAGALYSVTMAPGLLWGDSGEAQLHIILGGWYVNGEIVRSHVLYYAIARLLVWLLSVQAPLAGNLVSVLGGALTIANVAWIISHLVRSPIARWCGIALLLFSHTLWQLSTSAEVVTLTTALLTGELICVLKLMNTRRLRWLALAALLNGLGVSNHNFAMLMWPVYGILACVYWRAWGGDRLRKAALVAGSFLLGAAPVLILCADDYLQRGSGWGTLRSFLVGHYGHKVTNVGSLPGLLVRSAAMTVMNFPTPMVLLAVVGVWRLVRGSSRATAVLMLGGAAMFAGFAIRYNVPDQHTFLVPAFVFVAILTALGVDGLRLQWTPAQRVFAILLACLGPVAYMAAPPVLQRVAPNTAQLPLRQVPYRERFTWFLRPWRMGYHGAERFGREVLQSLPDDAVLGIDTTLAAPINYVQLANNLRRDVRLDCNYVRQDWFGATDWAMIRRRAIAEGRYFLGAKAREYWPRWIRCTGAEIEPAGLVFRVTSLLSDGACAQAEAARQKPE